MAIWRLYGMPRFGQFRSADGESPSAPATAAPPPSFWITVLTLASLMLLDISQIGTIVNPEMGPTIESIRSAPNLPPATWDAMPLAMTTDKKQWRVFGERLRIARLALGYQKATAFADALEMVPQTYRNYERGSRFPDPLDCQILASKGVSLNWFFLGIPPAVVALPPSPPPAAASPPRSR